MKKILAIILTLSFLSSLSIAAPNVTSVTGTIAEDQTLAIGGTGFGTKSTVKPSIYADFEAGTLSPSSLGGAISWGATGFMEATTTLPRSGTYCAGSTSGWGSANAYLNATASGMTYGSKWYISLWRRTTSTIDNSTVNMKFIRIWNVSGGGNYPNWYLGKPPGGTMISYVEDLTPTAANRQYPSWPYPNAEWRHEEYILKMNSAAGASDGYYQLKINGQNILTKTGWQTNSETRSNTFSQLFLQFDPSNYTADGNAWFDDIYVDAGYWQRVVIGNNATYANCTHLEIQTPTTWSNTEIQIKAQLGTFGAGDTKYLFVLDADEAVNTGYELTGVNPDTVEVTAPTEGATISGNTTISGTCTAGSGSVSGVQFKVDNTNIGSQDTSSPYSITWDTTGSIDGNHAITATCSNSGGGSTTSAAINVTVDNTVEIPVYEFTFEGPITIRGSMKIKN
jgi:hypothetical protein